MTDAPTTEPIREATARIERLRSAVRNANPTVRPAEPVRGETRVAAA